MATIDALLNRISSLYSVKSLSLVAILSSAFVFSGNSSAATITIDLDYPGAGYAVDDRSDGSFDRFVTGGYLISAQSRVTHFMDIYYVGRGIMEFDISSLTEPVASAFLSIQITGMNSNGQGAPVNFYGYEADGVAELSDAYLGDTLLLSDTLFTGIDPFEIDVTDFINQSLANNSDYLGISMRIANEYSSSAVGYRYEVEISGTGFQDPDSPFFGPYLTITTVPVPPAIFLFVSGILAFSMLRKRKNM